MEKKFETVTFIDNKKLFDAVAAYEEDLITEATANGSLEDQDADNEYTREIGRVGNLCADYESTYMTFKHLKFKKPLAAVFEEDLVAE